jgi:hypothetical protein
MRRIKEVLRLHHEAHLCPAPPPPPEKASPGCEDPFTLIDDGIGSPGSAIVKAVQQLGLTLQPGRAPIDTIIVDRLEKTSTKNCRFPRPYVIRTDHTLEKYDSGYSNARDQT